MATRQIKDAKDLSTHELIYFKGHAQATYMSDGRTVEEAINSSNGGESDANVVKGMIYEDRYIDGIVLPNGREIYINDGSSIVTNSDIQNKLEFSPIGTTLSEIENCFNGDVPLVNITLENLMYPEYLCYVGDEEGNICGYVIGYKMDWENDTITITILTYNCKLITITALGSSSEIYPNQINIIDLKNSTGGSSSGSVTSVKIDNISKTPSNGVVDLGYVNKKLTTSTSSSMTLSPNIYYRNTSTSLSTLTITLSSVSNPNIINEYFVEFTTRSSGTTVSFPSSVKWVDGVTPTWEAGYTYQVSIVNNLGSYQKFK